MGVVSIKGPQEGDPLKRPLKQHLRNFTSETRYLVSHVSAMSFFHTAELKRKTYYILLQYKAKAMMRGGKKIKSTKHHVSFFFFS